MKRAGVIFVAMVTILAIALWAWSKFAWIQATAEGKRFAVFARATDGHVHVAFFDGQKKELPKTWRYPSSLAFPFRSYTESFRMFTERSEYVQELGPVRGHYFQAAMADPHLQFHGYIRFVVGFPLWPALALLASLSAVITGVRWQRSRRWKRGRCGQCGYDLRGTVDGPCPECGTPKPMVPTPAPKTRPPNNGA